MALTAILIRSDWRTPTAGSRSQPTRVLLRRKRPRSCSSEESQGRARAVQLTGTSRFAQRQIERHRRLAPVADLVRSAAWQCSPSLLTPGHEYVVDEFFFTKTPFTVTGRRSDASPFNALLGLIFIGLPSLLYSLLGRFSLRPPPSDPEPDQDITESDADDS